MSEPPWQAEGFGFYFAPLSKHAKKVLLAKTAIKKGGLDARTAHAYRTPFLN